MTLPYVTFATCLLACGRVGFDAHTDGGSGTNGGDGGSATGDAGGNGDGGSGACVGAVPATTFPGGLPCASWGGSAQQINGSMTESNGTLVLTPNASSAGASVACQRSAVTLGAAGAFTEVSQVLTGTSSRTRLEIDWAGETYYIGAENNVMKAGREGITLTGGLIERWWRIRPSNGELAFETSVDGMTWSRFAGMGGIPTGIATLRVVAATPMSEAAPGTARFESVNVCP